MEGRLNLLDITNDAIASIMHTSPARSSPQGKFSQNNRVSALKNLCVCNAGVGHVRMNTACTIPCAASSTATSNGLVIAKAFNGISPFSITAKSKSEVVAVALACCACMESLENHISDPLAGKYVASDNGSFV